MSEHASEHTAETDTGLWLSTHYDEAKNSYVVWLKFEGEDVGALTPDTVFQYTRELLWVCTYAEYDAAVYAQWVDKVGAESAYQLVTDLQQHRAPITLEATGPLIYLPALTRPEREPVVLIEYKGKRVGTMSAQDAREHAMTLLEAVQVADLDSTYMRVLISSVGVERGPASGVISDLSNFRNRVLPPERGTDE